MKVRVKLFAVARELAGCNELKVELDSGATIADLRRTVAKSNPKLERILPHALWAVDTTYANDETKLDENSDIALIPPVSGG